MTAWQNKVRQHTDYFNHFTLESGHDFMDIVSMKESACLGFCFVGVGITRYMIQLTGTFDVGRKANSL